MYGILFLRCHARLKSRLRPAVMWQMHVINKTSFVLCSFQIIEPAVPELKCAWFYCLLPSYKSVLQLCGLSEHVDVAFITNQKFGYDSSAMVRHLFQNYDTIYVRFFPRILAIIPATRYTCVFCHVYLRFIPKYMTIFLQTRIYMRTKKPIYMRYKQACVYGVTESRRMRDTELYRQQKTPSCTMKLKSNFS